MTKCLSVLLQRLCIALPVTPGNGSTQIISWSLGEVLDYDLCVMDFLGTLKLTLLILRIFFGAFTILGGIQVFILWFYLKKISKIDIPLFHIYKFYCLALSIFIPFGSSIINNIKGIYKVIRYNFWWVQGFLNNPISKMGGGTGVIQSIFSAEALKNPTEGFSHISSIISPIEKKILVDERLKTIIENAHKSNDTLLDLKNVIDCFSHNSIQALGYYTQHPQTLKNIHHIELLDVLQSEKLRFQPTTKYLRVSENLTVAHSEHYDLILNANRQKICYPQHHATVLYENNWLSWVEQQAASNKYYSYIARASRSHSKTDVVCIRAGSSDIVEEVDRFFGKDEINLYNKIFDFKKKFGNDASIATQDSFVLAYINKPTLKKLFEEKLNEETFVNMITQRILEKKILPFTKTNEEKKFYAFHKANEITHDLVVSLAMVVDLEIEKSLNRSIINVLKDYQIYTDQGRPIVNVSIKKAPFNIDNFIENITFFDSLN